MIMIMMIDRLNYVRTKLDYLAAEDSSVHVYRS